jgi:hypothetical protein
MTQNMSEQKQNLKHQEFICNPDVRKFSAFFQSLSIMIPDCILWQREGYLLVALKYVDPRDSSISTSVVYK